VKTLVIGGGGLIGSSLCKSLSREFGKVQSPSTIPWGNTDQAVFELRRTVKDFLSKSAEERWIIAWCAGRGGFSSTSFELESEKNCLIGVLEELADSENNSGIFFFASSAGAVYTDSGSWVFTENSPTSVSNDYGKHKLEQETVISQFAQNTKTRCVIGRLVSVYGPNQNLQKPQGLISQLCLNSVKKTTTDIYVSLGTTRNYLFADDAANMIVHYVKYVENVIMEDDSYCYIKILCSHESVSISTVCKTLGNVTKKKALIKAYLSPNSPKYPQHFTVRSVTAPDLGQYCQTTLISGIGQILRNIGA
jgi:UDP-glucose 4-epimerase